MVKIDTNLHIYHKFDSNRVTGADYIHWNIWLQKLRFVFYSLPAVDEHSDSVSILAFTLTMSRYRQKVLVFSSEKAHQEQKKFYQTYFGHILWDERRNWGIQFASRDCIFDAQFPHKGERSRFLPFMTIDSSLSHIELQLVDPSRQRRTIKIGAVHKTIHPLKPEAIDRKVSNYSKFSYANELLEKNTVGY